MKKLNELHSLDKEVSAISLFKGELGTATAIQLQQKGTLKEHISKTPALLLCVTGFVTYKDETGKEINLVSGDYVDITPNVKHSLNASEESQLVLLK
jgi:quercetin dioxygenase-like cupin family protein